MMIMPNPNSRYKDFIRIWLLSLMSWDKLVEGMTKFYNRIENALY